jgi:hypothetical protein
MTTHRYTYSKMKRKRLFTREARFLAYTKEVPPPPGEEEGCWIWQLRLVDGYGVIQDEGKDRLAHVVAYEHYIGKVPKNKQVSHTCKQRDCVNPAHLIALSHKIVVNIGDSPTAIVHRTGICKKGTHKLEGENVIYTSDGFETCRQCRKDAQREWYLRKLAAQGMDPVGKGHPRTA